MADWQIGRTAERQNGRTAIKELFTSNTFFNVNNRGTRKESARCNNEKDHCKVLDKFLELKRHAAELSFVRLNVRKTNSFVFVKV